MRIGVDVSLLSGRITGIGRYLTNMLDALRKCGAEFCLYSSKYNGWMPIIGQDFDRMARIFFLQTIVPFRALKDDVDIFWGAAHRLPLFLPKRIARVVTIHDLVWKYAPATMKPLGRVADQIFMKQAVYEADRVLVVSESTSKDLSVQYPAVASRVRLVRPGIPLLPQSADLTELSFIGVDRPYVLFVGTVEPRKNLERLVKAYSSLPKKIIDLYPLVIVGGKGWIKTDLYQLVRCHNLESSVYFTGFVSDKQLATLYSYAHIVAMPSLYEGCGFPLLEAMSYGVPVLTSNTSSLPEVAGDAAVVVDPLDISSIATGLRRLLTDDVLYDAMSKHALHRASLFSWDKAAQETLAIFQEAIDENRLR